MTQMNGEDDYIEPVLDENDNPCWLKKKTGIIAESTTDTKIKEVLEKNKDLIKKEEFFLIKANTYECRKCKAQQIANPEIPIYCESCKRTSKFKRLSPSITRELWPLPRWKDIPIEKIEMKEVYERIDHLLKKCIIFPEAIYRKIFILWNMSTWKIDYWESVPFLLFTGYPDSGKSLCLDYSKELGNRLVNASNISTKAMVRISHLYSAGVMVDEIHSKLGKKTDPEFANFIKPSYRRGNIYTSCDLENQEEVYVYKNFGFRAFAGERLNERAIETRCIHFPMEKGDADIQKLSEIQDELDEIKIILLNYKVKTGEPPQIGIEDKFVMKGRKREIFEPLCRVAKQIEIPFDDVIEFANRRDKEEAEQLTNTYDYKVLKVIKEILETTNEDGKIRETLGYKEIIPKMHDDYDKWSDKDKRSEGSRIGYCIRGKSRLHLKTKRLTGGTVILVEKSKKRLEYLYKKFNLVKSETNVLSDRLKKMRKYIIDNKKSGRSITKEFICYKFKTDFNQCLERGLLIKIGKKKGDDTFDWCD